MHVTDCCMFRTSFLYYVAGEAPVRMHVSTCILIYRTELIWILILLQDELFMHLTNYSINKHNDNFDRDDSDDSGSKRYVQHS